MQDKYANAETFDGFRFEKMREQEGDDSKHLLVSLDLDYLLFGHGRHVWYNLVLRMLALANLALKPWAVSGEQRIEDYACPHSAELRCQDGQ
jgi:hypothetical protein